MNRFLLALVLILSLSIAGIIGYSIAYNRLASVPSPVSQPIPTQQTPAIYTQQQIADMQAELEQVELDLIENTKKQEKARNLIYYYQYQIQNLQSQMRNTSDRNIASMSQQSIFYCQGKIGESSAEAMMLEQEYKQLFERKLSLIAILKTNY